MSEHYHYIDKQTLQDIGAALWKIRQEKRMYLKQVQTQTKIPMKIIDGLETGRSFNYSAIRRLTKFYNKKMHITFE